MKRFFCILILVGLIGLLCACADNEKNDVLSLYYCAKDISYNNANSVIGEETLPIAADSIDISSVITQYLQGPNSPALKNIFPAETTLTGIQYEEDILYIHLSNTTDIPELELILACSCLAKTVFPITEANQIYFRTENGESLLDEPLFFTQESILTDSTLYQSH